MAIDQHTPRSSASSAGSGSSCTATARCFYILLLVSGAPFLPHSLTVLAAADPAAQSAESCLANATYLWGDANMNCDDACGTKGKAKMSCDAGCMKVRASKPTQGLREFGVTSSGF